MNYDLSVKEDRKKFVKRCNKLLEQQRTNVSVVDESNRTISQNCYIHVLCRILAQDIGVSELYAKQVYFKEIANPDIFIHVTKDPLTKQMIKTTKSTTELSVVEMSRAISRFIDWAAEEGYALPVATLNDDGSMTFNSENDKTMFHQAQIKTSNELMP